MKILFITTHNLATNPRLVKEAKLAMSEGYQVSVLCFEFNNWSKAINDKIVERLKSNIMYYGIPGNRKPFMPWLSSSGIHSFAKVLLKLFPKNSWLLGMRSNKRAWLLSKELKKIKETFDLVVAHNPGSFYPAMNYAQKNKIPFGIDLEDYHPGENSRDEISPTDRELQNAVLPKASYVSAASPLILEYAQKDSNIPLKNGIVVLNYFPSAEFIKPTTKENKKLKLVWFSQQISFNRGLEQLIPVIKDIPDIELHLFGNCDEGFKKEWLTGHENILIHSVLPQRELHKKLAEFDMGLALEPGKDLNNELAISNKILAYFQAGLYILASNTLAQKQFIDQHPEHGRISELEARELAETLNDLLDQKEYIRSKAIARFEKAKVFCWEEESKKLAAIWDSN
ncbi:MAG: hypothetical protein ABI237_06630 [Ginsengibacter sp.]